MMSVETPQIFKTFHLYFSFRKTCFVILFTRDFKLDKWFLSRFRPVKSECLNPRKIFQEVIGIYSFLLTALISRNWHLLREKPILPENSQPSPRLTWKVSRSSFPWGIVLLMLDINFHVWWCQVKPVKKIHRGHPGVGCSPGALQWCADGRFGGTQRLWHHHRKSPISENTASVPVR